MKNHHQDVNPYQHYIGYLTVEAAAEYASVSVRTFRNWIKDGLKHVRVSRKMIRTKPDWIEEYLDQFQEEHHEIEDVINEVMAEFI